MAYHTPFPFSINGERVGYFNWVGELPRTTNDGRSFQTLFVVESIDDGAADDITKMNVGQKIGSMEFYFDHGVAVRENCTIKSKTLDGASGKWTIELAFLRSRFHQGAF